MGLRGRVSGSDIVGMQALMLQVGRVHTHCLFSVAGKNKVGAAGGKPDVYIHPWLPPAYTMRVTVYLLTLDIRPFTSGMLACLRAEGPHAGTRLELGSHI